MKQIALFLCTSIFFLLSWSHSVPSHCSRPDTSELIYRGDGTDLDEIYSALATCPNITTLDLDFGWSGCVPSFEPWAFRFQPEDRFPALRKLSLTNYDLEDSWRQSHFYDHHWTLKERASYGLKSISQFFQNVYHGEYDQPVSVELPPPKESNLDKWLTAMDFSLIEDLHLAQEEKIFYEQMQDKLPNLKKLSLDWINSGADVPQDRVDFIKALPPLESLSIGIGAPYYYDTGKKNRTQFPLAAMLERHAPSLQQLELKQGETNEPNLRRPMLSVDEIDGIGFACPQLRHLGLDIDRDASFGWPNKTLDALARISSLESLTLRLEIGADLHDSREPGTYGWNYHGLDGPDIWFRQPRMSLDVAECLFDDLRAKKDGEQLKKAEFVVGAVEDKPYIGPLYIPDWVEGRGRSFVCELSSSGEPKCSIHGIHNPDRFDDY